MAWYTGDRFFDTVLLIGFVFAAFTLLGSLFVKSPYGRFGSEKMGVSLSPKLGWWLMEIPATIVFFWVYFQGGQAFQLVPLLLAGLWAVHYGNRGWFFPLSIRVAPGRKSTFSVSVILAGMFVTAIHGYLNARWFSDLGAQFTESWLSNPRFIVGMVIYVIGLFIILQSESIMRNLRPKNPQAGEASEYKIPYGGLFKYVTNPQYFGELTAWIGFSVLTWGLPGLLIFLISAGNLVPRAFATQKWYHEKFPDYPKDRKVLIPFVI